jgi:integrase
MPVDDLWHLSRPPKDAAACGEHGKLVASGRHGRGKRYRVRYADPGGEPQTQAFDKKADAEAFDLKVRGEVARGEYVDPSAGKITLAAYAKDWLAARSVDASTLQALRSRFENHVYASSIGGRELRVLAQRPSLIQAWLKGLESSLAASTIHTILAGVSTVFAAAVDDGLIARNPCLASSVQPPVAARTKVRPWTGERASAVRAGLPARYATLADVGAGAGMRQGEVFGLAVEDVDFLRHNIHVQRQVKRIGGHPVFAPPKSGKDRDVPLPDVLAMRLSAHLQQWPAAAVTLPWRSPGGPPVTARLIFTGQGRQATNRNYFNTQWKLALVAAGVIPQPEPGERYAPSRDQGFHQLRHFYASAALAEGVDIRALAEFLGHEDPGFTLRVYAHLMPQSKDRVRKALDAALASFVPALYRESS